jgi:carboxymethylenebutenolidase
MTGQKIKIPAADGGAFSAHLARPQSGAAPLIVMLHEIYGVTDWVRETADMFATQGYLVVAPDMFWRLEPDFEADHRDSSQRDQGLKYRGMIDHDKAVDDIAATITALKSHPDSNGKFGVTGFCMGGTLTYMAAARLQIDAAVAYYGTQIHEHLDEGGNITCPTLLHFGDLDDHVPVELADQIRGALAGNPAISFERYDAGHAFSNDHRPGFFDQTASDAAHARTFEVFEKLK